MAGAGLILTLLVVLGGWAAYTLRDDALAALEAVPQIAQRAQEAVWQSEAQPASAPLRPDPAAGAEKPSIDGATIDGWLQQAVGSLAALAGHLMAIVFLVFFLLISRDHFRRRAVEIAGARPERRVTVAIIDDINAQIQRFLLVRVITSAVVAAATWIVLAWMGVQYAAVWGILAGVFNSIPYFGPVLVSGGLLVVGVVQSGDLMEGIKMAGAALVITSLEGWLLEPPLMGKAEHMHVVVVFFGVLLWTWIWGGWGTILAVPMLVIAKSVADRVPSLKPLGRLMAP